MPALFLRILSTVCVCGLSLHAQEEKKAAVTPVMREVSPGVYKIGAIHLDKNTRSLSFPGKLNMAEGNIEYLICTPRGSTHESLILTEVPPSDVHFAMLLLDAKGAGLLAPAPGDAPPPQINAEYLKGAPRLKGDNIMISVKWKDAAGKEHGASAEDWAFNTRENKPAPRGPWIYTGSMFADNQFLAQLQGSIASLVNNPAALINNPRKGSDDDQVWMVNTKAVPAVETPLEITIKFVSKPDQKPK